VGRCHLRRQVIASDTLLSPNPLRQLGSHFNSYKRYGICFPVIVYVEVAVMDAYVLFPAMQVPVWYRPPVEGEFAESMGSWNNGHAVLQRERRSFVKVPAGGGEKQQPSLMAPPCRPPASPRRLQSYAFKEFTYRRNRTEDQHTTLHHCACGGALLYMISSHMGNTRRSGRSNRTEAQRW